MGPGRQRDLAYTGIGAYGLCLHLPELQAVARWLLPQRPDAPSLELSQQVCPPADLPSRLDCDRADLALLGGGRLQAIREEDRVVFRVPRALGSDELVHPYLAPAAALVWQWRGAEALHAGVVAIGRGAVLLLGEKESGKSTTLAWLAAEGGCPVLADDLAVIRGGHVLAGPRSLDLRPSPESLGGVSVRGGGRLRVELSPAPGSLPVAGCVLLAWGDRDETLRVAVSERLAILAAQRTYPLPGDPVALLELAALPMFRLVRRRDPAGLADSARSLLRLFS